MGDIGTIFKEHKDFMKKKKANNREDSIKILKENNIDFTLKNNGTHCIIQKESIIIDFWPGTGLFINRNGHKGRGIFNLLKEVNNA